MGRDITPTLQSILDSGFYEINKTVELVFPNQASFKLATAPLEILKGSFTNDVESVSSIKQSLESPTDRVSVRLQNKDRVLGLDIASSWQQWRSAEAIIGRFYDNSSDSEWIEMFRGTVQAPETDDFSILFDVATDPVAFGRMSFQNLGDSCGLVFKGQRCGYAGSETACNHQLKSKDGCDGRNIGHRYGGMEDRSNPDEDAPGTGGNIIVPPDRGVGCPRLDQYVLVRGDDGSEKAKQVGFLKEQDLLYNPIDREYYPIQSLQLLKQSSIWGLRCSNDAASYSSDSHLVMPHAGHDVGVVITSIETGDAVLTYERGGLCVVTASSSKQIDVQSDVLRIEMSAGHVYCSSDNPNGPFVVAHNSKGNPFDDGQGREGGVIV